MKKKRPFILLFLLSIVLFNACTNTSSSEASKPDKICVGITSEDFFRLAPPLNEMVCSAGFCFYFDELENPTLVHIDSGTWLVDRIEVYEKNQSKPTATDFQALENGMTLYEVVELLGVPIGTALYGMIGFTFEADTGETYILTFKTPYASDELQLCGIRTPEDE